LAGTSIATVPRDAASSNARSRKAIADRAGGDIRWCRRRPTTGTALTTPPAACRGDLRPDPRRVADHEIEPPAGEDVGELRLVVEPGEDAVPLEPPLGRVQERPLRPQPPQGRSLPTRQPPRRAEQRGRASDRDQVAQLLAHRIGAGVEQFGRGLLLGRSQFAGGARLSGPTATAAARRA
jgi:hypothetical protein